MEKITLGEEHIETIGLLFEPNFFQIHCYSDSEGADFKETVSLPYAEEYDFDEVRSKNSLFALVSNPHWTLVPTAVYRDEDAVRYLELNTGFEKGSSFTHSIIEGLETTLVYENDLRAEKIVNDWQPGLQTQHLANALLEYSRRKAKNGSGDFLRIEVLDGMAIFCLFKEGTLLLANCIEVSKAEDLIYYIFFSLKKLHISTKVFTEISGSGKLCRSVEKEAARYLSNVNSTSSGTAPAKLSEIIPQCV